MLRGEGGYLLAVAPAVQIQRVDPVARRRQPGGGVLPGVGGLNETVDEHDWGARRTPLPEAGAEVPGPDVGEARRDGHRFPGHRVVAEREDRAHDDQDCDAERDPPKPPSPPALSGHAQSLARRNKLPAAANF